MFSFSIPVVSFLSFACLCVRDSMPLVPATRVPHHSPGQQGPLGALGESAPPPLRATAFTIPVIVPPFFSSALRSFALRSRSGCGVRLFGTDSNVDRLRVRLMRKKGPGRGPESAISEAASSRVPAGDPSQDFPRRPAVGSGRGARVRIFRGRQQ